MNGYQSYIRTQSSYRSFFEYIYASTQKLDVCDEEILRGCKNFIDQRRRFRISDGDAEAICKLFFTMQQSDSEFFYAIDLDNELNLSNVFWVHSRCRAAYQEFHDVISFDTTYLVNRYKMPFATSVGVNHHGQSILLGCALLSHEAADTFKWLFRTWITAMGGVHPNAILTDQCESIRKSVREDMPNTIHRFCLWHILCKIPEKFKGVVDYDDAIKDFKALIYDCLSVRMFDKNWENFLRKYSLERNEWLAKLYLDKDWVPIYLRHIFWAGMLSTQRSESMHAFFDGYVNSRSTLKQFVDQYEIAIRAKLEKEFIADFHSKYKAEIKRLWYCHFVPAPDEDLDQQKAIEGVEHHYILERSIVNDWYVKEFVYKVSYRENGQYFDCICKKIKSRGVICCHILRVMIEKTIDHIIERYLFRRWRKDVHRHYMKMVFSGGYPQMTEEYKKYKELEKTFSKINDLAFDDNNKLQFIKQGIEEIKNGLLNWNNGMIHQRNPTYADNLQQYEDIAHLVRDPLVARSRGRPRINRQRGKRELGNRRGGWGGRRNNSTSNYAEQVGEHSSQNLESITASIYTANRFDFNIIQHTRNFNDTESSFDLNFEGLE